MDDDDCRRTWMKKKRKEMNNRNDLVREDGDVWNDV